MEMPSHKIKSQIFELRAGSEAIARSVQDATSRMHARRVVPILDRVCDEVSAPGVLYRLDRVEVDLGVIAASDFEDEVARRLPGALRRALLERRSLDHDISQGGGEAGRKINTQNLPASPPPCENLSERPSPELGRAAQDDARIAASLELFEHFARTGALPWWADVGQRGLLADNARALLRDAPRALAQLLRALARTPDAVRRIGLAYDGAILEEIHALLVPGLDEAVRAVLRRAIDPAEASVLVGPLARDTEVRRREEDRKGAGGTQGAQGEVRRREEDRKGAGGTQGALHEEEEARAMFGTVLPHSSPNPRAPCVPLAPLRSSLRDPWQDAGPGSRVVSTFVEPEELYVHDSGLVLLWPFLRGLFRRLGLVEDRAFVDAQAQNRAAAILSCLGSGEREIEEILLPLPKILCGLDTDAVVDPGEPITDAEAEACEHLLTAAIAEAPILDAMSIPAFRETFLQRLGALDACYGALRLRVARETFDVVLDRLPWSFEWVLLPWMRAPLYVEWR